MRISVFGLGYVGAVSAACFARNGHEIVGVDTNPSKVQSFNAGRAPVVHAPSEVFAFMRIDAYIVTPMSLDVAARPAEAIARCELYRLLADPVRVRLLGLTAAEELAVGELAELLRVLKR